MKENKNIIKGNKYADLKTVRKQNFYAVVELKTKDSSKSIVLEHFGTRIQAKNELERLAKVYGGKITYFGKFKN